MGFNCAAPARLAAAYEVAATVVGLPLVAYPNRGEQWRPGIGWDPSTGGDPLAATERLLDAGERLIGGCCRTTAEDIARLAARIAQR